MIGGAQRSGTRFDGVPEGTNKVNRSFDREVPFQKHDDLDFRRVVHIFLRTWPFIRPEVCHLALFVLVSTAIALFIAALLFTIKSLMNGASGGGNPLGELHVIVPRAFLSTGDIPDEAWWGYHHVDASGVAAR